jgi:ribosomal protein S18 acetylase RimI-like enzyme
MTTTRRAAFLDALWVHYFDDLVGAGLREQDAHQNIEMNKRNVLHDGEPVEGQYFFEVVHDGEVVGQLWVARRGPEGSTEFFVYDVAIDEARRGQGLGRATMVAAEEFARANGGTRLGLSVFGPNTVARALYESLGYRTMAANMIKDL